MVARDYAEGLQRRTLAVTTYELIMDSFPQVKYRYSSYSPIKLEKLPHTSVASITYTLADNSVQTLPVSAYLVKESGEIVPAVGYNWPNAALAAGDAVKVRYTAGYTTETIPPSTKHGLLLLIGHWYENREAVVIGKIPAKVPLAAQSLLDMDRRF
jgi:uncharacterized phiE125 gp8 family phage protein